MEKHYAFIKNNRVMTTAVFASQDEELADKIAQQQGYDDAIWVGEEPPHIHSLYNGTSFTIPTKEYLLSIGVIAEVPNE